MPNAPTHNTQSGNVFLFVLLGVALFTALAFVISRGMRSDSATGISQRQSELAAVDIIDYAQGLERAVTKLRQRGVSENDIDFTNAFVAGYSHTPVQPSENKVFERAGGGVSWKDGPPDANDGSPWLFTGATCIPDVGAGGAGCESDGVNNEELLAVLPNLKVSVCQEIDKRLGITAIPSGGTISASQFTGTFADNGAPSGVDGRTAACVLSGGNYYFYYVLLAR